MIHGVVKLRYELTLAINVLKARSSPHLQEIDFYDVLKN
jgi:hypothetical protein